MLIRSLRAQGLAILYISHFLEEVAQIADRYTVLRDGRSVASGDMAGIGLEDIVKLMAGRAIEQVFPRSKRTPGEPVLELSELAGVQKPISASLVLRRGEVLGIAGLVGAGRSELLRAVFGLDPVKHGRIRLGAYVGAASPARRLAQGMGLLSEDRTLEGLALSLSVAENLTLSRPLPSGSLFVSPRLQRRTARRWIERLDIRCQGPAQPCAELSGGNQQKVALARLLHHDVDVLLLDEPTRGIDLASRAEIYGLIDELAARGKALLVVSSTLPELLGLCDRIHVMHRGVLGPAQQAADLDEHSLLLQATGA
jgi:ribose transport system ATP-binding protein